MAATTLLSDNGVSSGITGYQLTGGNDGTLQLKTTTAGGTATTAMTIDATQNVGVGVTPNAWAGGNTALQMAGPSMWGASGVSHWSTNTYFDGSNYKYISSNYVTDYYQLNGAHVWRTAASGTAGASVSALNESMRIDSSGNVGIGTASPNVNTNGTVLHINNSTASRAAIVHFTTAASGSAASDGLIVGKWSDDTNYIFDYDSNPIVFGINSGEAMRIDTGRNLLVGTTSKVNNAFVSFSTGIGAGTILGINNNSNVSYAPIVFQTGGTNVGYISSTTTATSYVTSSDYRLKENVQPMTGALSVVSRLKPCTYTWKVNGEQGQGFIAHELAEVVPDCVTGEKDAVDEDGNPKYQGIDTSFLVATLTAAIQELKADLDATKAELAALKGQA